MAKIRVLSLDYDGCLAQRDFHGDIAAHNPTLTTELQKNRSDYLKTIVFIGSNRQSKRDDDRNLRSSNNGSCYRNISSFAAEIKAEFDPFLASDAYNGAKSGTAFQEALDNLDNEGFNHKGWLHDKSKISVIYSQMQKIASEYPNDEIDFEFFDDKDNILKDLQTFFTENSHLIPRQMNLKLYHYAGKEVVLHAAIKGNGDFVNVDYAKSVRKFGDNVLADLAKQGNLFAANGDEASAETIQQEQYNCGIEISVKDYLNYFLDAHAPAESLAANFLIQILASKEMKAIAGIAVVAGFAALTLGSFGMVGVIAALAGTAGVIAASIGGATMVGGGVLGLCSFFAAKRLESSTKPLVFAPSLN